MGTGAKTVPPAVSRFMGGREAEEEEGLAGGRGDEEPPPPDIRLSILNDEKAEAPPPPLGRGDDDADSGCCYGRATIAVRAAESGWLLWMVMMMICAQTPVFGRRGTAIGRRNANPRGLVKIPEIALAR